MITTLTTITTPKDNLEQLRKNLLDNYRKKQPLRVAIGKSNWLYYEPEKFNPAYNLREILNDEIVIEFDTDKELASKGIMQTAYNLALAGYSFEIWNHNGRSPHLHIHNLKDIHKVTIGNLEQNKLKMFKKLFIRKYVSIDFLKYVDLTLTGIHLVRLEYSPCWKGKYDVKLPMVHYEINSEPLKSQLEQERSWLK